MGGGTNCKASDQPGDWVSMVGPVSTPMRRIQAFKHVTGMLQSESENGFLSSYNSRFCHHFIHIHTSTHSSCALLAYTHTLCYTYKQFQTWVFLCYHFFKHTKMYVHLSPLPVNSSHQSSSLWLKHADHTYSTEMTDVTGVQPHKHTHPLTNQEIGPFWKSLIVFMNYNCGDIT